MWITASASLDMSVARVHNLNDANQRGIDGPRELATVPAYMVESGFQLLLDPDPYRLVTVELMTAYTVLGYQDVDASITLIPAVPVDLHGHPNGSASYSLHTSDYDIGPGNVFQGSVIIDSWPYAFADFTPERLMGDDSISGSSMNDVLYGYGGDDELFGNNGDDVLLGGDGQDDLAGGAGSDTMTGGDGDDTYEVESPSDVVVEYSHQGTDTVVIGQNFDGSTYTVPANVENVRCDSGSPLTILAMLASDSPANGHNIRGGYGPTTMIGGFGNDVLQTGGSPSTLQGGPGDDTYVLLFPDDVIIEQVNEGIDTVVTYFSYSLAGTSLENVTVVGDSVFSLTITGNQLDNVFVSDATFDTFIGRGGDDTYCLQSGSQVVENPGEGTDTVIAPFSFSLLGTNLENIFLQGSGDYIATGNPAKNVLTGNSGHNVLRGEGGDDILTGGLGYDTAAFTGSLNQYAFVEYLGSIRVVDRVANRDGVDITQDVEQASFSGDNVTAVFTASDIFTPLEYIASYSDLMVGFGANAQLGYEHFVNTGRFALRTASFDGLEYLASYPDLIAGLGMNADAATIHYIQSGRFEARTVSFNGLEYIASYTDLIDSFGVNEDLGTSHYLSAGRFEGRTVTFRGLEYLASNPDLMAGYGANFELATVHYISAGRFEGRASSFHALEYIASYPDLIEGLGANLDAGARHYINSGRFEGRTEHFDAAQYLANYADLAAGFGNNHELAAIHFIQHGFYEGRTDHPL